MRLFNTLLALLPVAALAKSDVFDTYRAQSFPIKLSDKNFDQVTAATPRDYATVVLLTALDARFGCAACHEFQPDWDFLSRSWQRGDKKGESKVLFATVDFAEGRETFTKLKLQHAPVLMLYPPTTGPNAKPGAEPARFDFSGGIARAEGVHEWISKQLPAGLKPAISRPFNWTKFIFVTTTVLGTISAIAVAAPYVMPILQNRNVWAAISLLLVLLFTSGHMFNHIRKVPYVAGDGRGGISYFAAGFQSQYGMETQVIAALYGVLSFAAINLAVKCPRIVDAKQQSVAVLLWAGTLFFTYSFLLNVFRWKNGSYPFFLPPF